MHRPQNLIHDDHVTTLSNGLVEVDGAIDAPYFDRASAEPAVQVDQDGFKIVNQPTENAIAASPTLTQV